MLKLGSQGISALRLGGTEIKRAYLGDTLVFGAPDTPTPPDPPEPAAYTITATIDPSGSGTVSGAGAYQAGETVTITAEPGDGYKFSGWQENGVVVSENAAYTFTVTGDRTLAAVFEVKRDPILPTEYTELEYIRSLTANAYVSGNYRYQPAVAAGTLRADTVLAVSAYPETFPTSPTSIGSTTVYSSASNNIICVRAVTTSLSRILMVWFSPLGIVVSVGYYSGSGTTQYRNITIPNTTTSKWYEIILDIANKTISVDGVSYSLPVPGNGFPSFADVSVYIGNALSSSSDKYLCNYRVGEYSLRSTSNTAALSNRHGIPAKRVSDSRVGFYDLTSATFLNPYANNTLSTPQWAAGPTVEY